MTRARCASPWPATAIGASAAAQINRALVEAGVEVHLLEPSRVSLEDRFLEITSRLGDEP